jgi:hypothetical protein
LLKSEEPNLYDEETSGFVCEILKLALELAENTDEIQQCFSLNEELFLHLNEKHKNRLRCEWRSAMERIK